MKARPSPRTYSLHRLIDHAEIPARAIGIFWLGGPAVAFKTSAKCVYVVDPVFSDREDRGPVGAIDVRPDLVLCTLGAPEGIDVSSLSHIATAYPEARFVGSETSRDCMIGRGGHVGSDEVPINPARVHVIDPGLRMDIRRLGLRDSLRILALPDGDGHGSMNTIFSFGALHVCLARRVSGSEGVDRLCEAARPKVDVLVWSLSGANHEVFPEAVERLRPRYAVPIGYDRGLDGRTAARTFREQAAGVTGVQVYLFPEDYMEGLVYSRIMRRRKS